MHAGIWENLDTWLLENDVFHKVLRMWQDGWADDDTCRFVYIYQAVQLPDGDYLIGVREYDDAYPDRMYPGIDYVRFSKVTFAYFDGDQDELEEE